MNREFRRVCSDTLREVFGVQGYRPGQKAAASCLLSGRDLLCILPTGAGKSLCWQLPAVVHPGLTLVVSPLIALMADQVASLRRKGIPAAALNSLMAAEERDAVEKQIREGEVRILFVSPERLETTAFRSLCRAVPPWLLVVDEAHCIVQWGADFRPAYAHIGAFVGTLAHRPVVCAMTATADARMQQQIKRSLGMSFVRHVTLPVLRENLVYTVRPTASPTREILRLMRSSPCRTVVFCQSRGRTESLAAALRRAGCPAEHYHAGLGREVRLSVQERFRRGEIQLLTATTAFGMGVDIPDIRRVIHDRLPENITDLVQQCGRAGRDGERAECIILIGVDDLFVSREVLRSIRQATRGKPLHLWRLMRKVWRPRRRMLRALLAKRCIPAALAEAFGQRARPCGGCSACLQGALTARPPDLLWGREEALRLFFLSMQRDALARRRGLRPERLIGPVRMMHMARTLSLPPLHDEEAERAMERVLQALRPRAPEDENPSPKAADSKK